MNGLKVIRTRCNLSMNDLAGVLGVSRQQIGAWENNVKQIPEVRLQQMESYFGIDQKYFLEITEADKSYLLGRELYLRDDSKKERYRFMPQREKEAEDYEHSYNYPQFEVSLEEKLSEARKNKQQTIDEISGAIGYFGIPEKDMDEILAINRGCLVYDAVTRYLYQMPNELNGVRMPYYSMLRNVLYALLYANDLITKADLEDLFLPELKGSALYDDEEWVFELAEQFKEKYKEKEQLVRQSNMKNGTQQVLKTEYKPLKWNVVTCPYPQNGDS